MIQPWAIPCWIRIVPALTPWLNRRVWRKWVTETINHLGFTQNLNLKTIDELVKFPEKSKLALLEMGGLQLNRKKKTSALPKFHSAINFIIKSVTVIDQGIIFVPNDGNRTLSQELDNYYHLRITTVFQGRSNIGNNCESREFS